MHILWNINIMYLYILLVQFVITLKLIQINDKREGSKTLN